MSDLPSPKLLKKSFWTVGILMLLALGIRISLYFTITLDEIKEYSLVYRYWYGIYLASEVIVGLLACCWVVLLIMRLVIAALRKRAAKPKPGDPNWTIEPIDLSDFD